MSMPQTATLLHHLRQWAAGPWDDPHSDRELLHRFAVERDEAAFAALVRRHGPMVLSVCRRILHQTQDAEDAFQATFLVLFRKAGSRFWRDSVGGWLHRVAARIALRLRADRTGVSPLSSPQQARDSDPLEQLTVRELLAAFDEELAGLPERYRAPLVLCHLEGKTQEEAARRLGRSLSTIRRRLERGRKLLHQRLMRRGLELPAALGAVLLSREVSAVVPVTLRIALTQTLNGSVSARIAVLAQGALQAMSIAKLRTAVAWVLMLGAFAAGAGGTIRWTLAEKPAEPIPPAQAPKVESVRTERKDYYGDPLPPGAVARMGSVQLRHEMARLAFSADGKTLITAGWDATVRFWDMTTGKQTRLTCVPLPKDLSSQPDVAIAGLSRNGQVLVLFEGEAVVLYDTTTGEKLRRLPAEGIGRKLLAFSADGKLLATLIGNRDNSALRLRLWDLSTPKERLRLDKLIHVANFRNTLVLSSDGSRLAFETFETEWVLHVLDTATGRELGKGPVEGWCFAFSPDSKMLAAAANHNNQATATLWETDGLKKRATLRPSPGVTKRVIERPCLTFSPDGKLLVMGGLEAVVIWDVSTGKERLRLDDRQAKQMLFSADGKTLACAGPFEIHLWNIETGQRLHARAGHDNWVETVAVSPDGRVVASADWSDSVVRLWEAATGKPLPFSPRHDDGIRSCAFASDGRLLISGYSGVVRLLDAVTGAEQRRFVVTDRKTGKQNQDIVVSHLSADGKRLAAVSTGQKAGNQLTLWNARTGDLLTQRPFNGMFSSFTPDGAGVTVDGREHLTIEDTRTGQVLASISGDLGQPTAFSSDGQFLAVGLRESRDDGFGSGPSWQPLGVRVIEMASREELFHVDGWINYTTFSPDGRRLVTTDPDSLRLWDVPTGELLLRRPWPADSAGKASWTPIRSLAFLPNGRALVTGMSDGTLLVWDMTPPMRKPESNKTLTHRDLKALWPDLAGDARKAQRAMHTLIASRGPALSLLAQHLRPSATVDAKRVDKLLADLDSEQFAVREAASKELTGMGQQIEASLQRVLENKPSLEIRNRVRAVQESLRGVPPASTLRTLRAIRVLEMIGTEEARQLLRKLADGAAGARETHEAKAALQRWTRPASSGH